MGAFRDAQIVHNQIQAARQDDGATLNRNLKPVLGGQPIDSTMAERYSAAGLLDAEQQHDGLTSFRLSEAGASLLPREVQQVQAAKTQRASQRVQQQPVSQYPALALPGSPESVAFLSAFRLNGGNLAGAVQSVYRR